MAIRSTLSIALALAMVSPALASSDVTFNQIDVQSSLPPSHIGIDSGVPFSGTGVVRVSASGTIVLANNACATAVTPEGCNVNSGDDSLLAPHQLGLGTLEAAFTDASNSLVTNWTAVGSYASLVIPSRAKHLIYRLNNVDSPGSGSFHVVTDIAPSDAAAMSVGRKAVSRSTGPARGLRDAATKTQAPGTSTADVQYLLRRFGFSATPAEVAKIVREGGASAWLNAQIKGLDLQDDNAGIIRPLPGEGDDDIKQSAAFRLRELDLDIASNRQLLQKVTWHWAQHFSVGFAKIHTDWEYNGGTMQHYIETLRKDALGNFGKLVTDVSEEPAILIWLDNLNNNGNNPNVPPNQNFARELLQLYTVGPFTLHSDGTPYTDGKGNPIARYSSADISTISYAVSGWTLHQGACDTAGCAYPKVSQISVFDPALHATGPQFETYSFIDHDHTFSDPGNAPGNTSHAQCAWNRQDRGVGSCVMANLVNVLAHDTNTAPFESKELIQRFATENPSRGYVSRIAKVWTSTVDDKDQIAKVIVAIAEDPEFYASRYTSVKEPIEFSVDAIRALGGETQNPWPNEEYSVYVWKYLINAGQPLFDPPSVFGYYVPGPPPNGKESLLNTETLLAEWSNAGGLADHPFGGCPGTSCRNVNLGLENTGLSSLPSLNIPLTTKASADAASTYLLNALVDGGNAGLQALVSNYILGYPSYGSDTRITHAIWLILSSPEYEVN